MTVTWNYHGGRVTEEDGEINSVGIETPEPILACSEDYEYKAKMAKQADIGVRLWLLFALAFSPLLIYFGWELCSWIDKL